MKKILLISIPRLSPAPQASLRSLKVALSHADIEADIFDANLDLYKKFSQHPLWVELEKWGIENTKKKHTDHRVWDLISQTLEQWAEYIKSKKPTHVGISVFTVESRAWAQWLCATLRQNCPDIEILLGGKGLNDPGLPRAIFGDYCLRWGLCDHYFNGEAEKTLVDYMKDRPCIIDNYDSFTSLDDINVNGFDTHDNAEYNIISDWYDPPINEEIKKNFTVGEKKISGPRFFDFDYSTVYTTSSTRGCVKSCQFCDVPLLRPRFSMRDPQNLFAELRWAIEEKNCRLVAFKDDMINGSNSQFHRWMSVLADYLEQNNITDFKWISQFGIKSRKGHPTETFDLLARTGAYLQIGIDHFSPAVLGHMKKMYTDEDIFWFFETASTKNINYKLLGFVIGYPTETEKDFEKLLDGIQNLYAYRKQIHSWDFGNICSVPFGSALYDLPGMHIGNDQKTWFYEHNPLLTYDERKNRVARLDQLSNTLNLVQARPQSAMIRIQV